MNPCTYQASAKGKGQCMSSINVIQKTVFSKFLCWTILLTALIKWIWHGLLGYTADTQTALLLLDFWQSGCSGQCMHFKQNSRTWSSKLHLPLPPAATSQNHQSQEKTEISDELLLLTSSVCIQSLMYLIPLWCTAPSFSKKILKIHQ